MLISSYTDDDALADGVFVEVTPESMKKKCRIVCTPTVQAEFSLAAIMEMYNGFVMKFRKGIAHTHGKQNYATIEKMNGKDIWVYSCILAGKPAIKMFFPYEA